MSWEALARLRRLSSRVVFGVAFRHIRTQVERGVVSLTAVMCCTTVVYHTWLFWFGVVRVCRILNCQKLSKLSRPSRPSVVLYAVLCVETKVLKTNVISVNDASYIRRWVMAVARNPSRARFNFMPFRGDHRVENCNGHPPSPRVVDTTFCGTPCHNCFTVTMPTFFFVELQLLFPTAP